MITESVEVKTYKKKLFCNKCMTEVEATNKMDMSGNFYQHKCTKCGNTMSSAEKYPKIYYVEVEEND